MDDDQYALSDLRQLISARTGHFSHPIDPFSGHRSSQLPHFDPIYHQYMSPPPPTSHGSFAAAVPPQTSSAAAVTSLFAVDMDCGRGLFTEGGNSRWPRQETLTLLEIRSRLDSKFREVNHKGPLWDEVSRIMSEEHGYQRSGKKCREKFENLYKYYKKTKEGRAGRQDGKNYRFFRQLEAIYGDPTSFPTNNNCNPQETPYPHNCNDIFSDQTGKATFADNHSFSISNSSHEFETSSSDNNEEYDLSAVAFMMSRSQDKNKKQLCTDDTDRPIEGFKRNRRPSGWKDKVKSFVDSQMKTIIERQDIWMDTMARSFEQREQERVIREIEWKKQETARFDREHAMWAKERAWIEARDAALMEALKKFTGQGLDLSLPKVRQITDHRHRPVRFDEMNQAVDETEILALIQVRTGMEPGFQECGYSCDDHGVWEVVAEKMGCMGYNLTGVECKDKWENIRSSFIKMTDHDQNNNKG